MGDRLLHILTFHFVLTDRFNFWKIFSCDSRVIFVPTPPLHLLQQAIADSGGYSKIEVVQRIELIGDLHVFEHVFDGKVRLKITLYHFRHFHRQSGGITRIGFHRFDEPFQRQT